MPSLETRECASCGEVKSVTSIWYLMADGSGGFLCGGCFTEDEGSPEAVW